MRRSVLCIPEQRAGDQYEDPLGGFTGNGVYVFVCVGKYCFSASRLGTFPSLPFLAQSSAHSRTQSLFLVGKQRTSEPGGGEKGKPPQLLLCQGSDKPELGEETR